MVQHLDPPTLYQPPQYSQVVRAGPLIFVSGQCAHVPDGAARTGTLLSPADPTAQARQCYQNVRLALEGAGARMADVVKINTYSTHPDYRKLLMDLRTTYFDPPYPASTGVVVPSLFAPEALFEVEAIAVARDGPDAPTLEFIDPPTLSKSSIYAAVVRAGDLVFTAGQCAHVPTDGTPTRSHRIVGRADPYVQARQCYQNVQYAVEAAGASMADVVKLNTWSTHPDWRRVLMEVRPEFFAAPFPASTGVVVTSLFTPEAMFEVEAIAVRRDGHGPAPQFFDPTTLSRSASYAAAARAGNLVFTAGQCAHVPREPDDPTPGHYIVGPADPYVQARQCYQNVQHAVEAAGASMADVVKLNAYSTHSDWRKVLNAVRAEFFTLPYPASTGLVVTSLSRPESIFEVEAIAVVDA